MAYTYPNISCISSDFSIPFLPGAEFISFTASFVQNYTSPSPPFSNPNHGTISPVTLDFCNVTVIHKHEGHNEAISTQVWLPNNTWNGRLQAQGGGGYIAGLQTWMLTGMEAALAEGYAAVGTNAGLYTVFEDGSDANIWFLPSERKVNYHPFNDFASTSLNDMAVIGKSVVKQYYGEAQTYSYFSGCSNGGRQGYVLAQKYPHAFDGIAASAPALYWDEWTEHYWAQQLMDEKGEYPWPCELDALSKAAIETCDEMDGVKDGILQEPDACDFDPKSMIGRSIECKDAGKAVKISKIAAEIAEGVWKSKRQEGVNFQGEESGFDADLKFAGATTCNNGTCIGNVHPLTVNWIRIFLKKDLSWNPGNLTRSEFEALRQQGVRKFNSIIGVPSDLSGFRKAGGKLITYQGMSDIAISYKNTLRFYEAAKGDDQSTHDFYRLFLAPGLGHCYGGKGAYPNTTFHALVDWVENGKAPELLKATSDPDSSGAIINRILCPYPEKVRYIGNGDVNDFGSWTCTK